MFKEAFELQFEETTLVPVNLQSWMDLTNTPENIQKEIIGKMENDLNGGDKTGFYPYSKEGQIYFDHRWLLLIGKKKTNPYLLKQKKRSVAQSNKSQVG